MLHCLSFPDDSLLDESLQYVISTFSKSFSKDKSNSLLCWLKICFVHFQKWIGAVWLCKCGCHYLLHGMPQFVLRPETVKGALYFMMSSERRCEQENHLPLLCVICSRGAAHLMFEVKKNDALRLYYFTRVFIPFLLFMKANLSNFFFFYLIWLWGKQSMVANQLLAQHTFALFY